MILVLQRRNLPGAGLPADTGDTFLHRWGLRGIQGRTGSPCTPLPGTAPLVWAWLEWGGTLRGTVDLNALFFGSCQRGASKGWDAQDRAPLLCQKAAGAAGPFPRLCSPPLEDTGENNPGRAVEEVGQSFCFSNPIPNVCAILYFTNKTEKSCESNQGAFSRSLRRDGRNKGGDKVPRASLGDPCLRSPWGTARAPLQSAGEGAPAQLLSTRAPTGAGTR